MYYLYWEFLILCFSAVAVAVSVSTMHFVNFLLLLLVVVLSLSLSLSLCFHVFYLFWIADARNPHKYTSVTNRLNKTTVCVGCKVAGKKVAQAQHYATIFSKKIVPKISFHTFYINKTNGKREWVCVCACESERESEMEIDGEKLIEV